MGAYTTRQLIWLEACRRRLRQLGALEDVRSAAARSGRRPRTVGLDWADLDGWLEASPAGLSPEEASGRAGELRPEVERLVERWPALATADGDARRVALGGLSFLEARRAFMDIEEHERALTDWVGLSELFEELSGNALYPRARGLLLSYLEIHPGLQL